MPRKQETAAARTAAALTVDQLHGLIAEIVREQVYEFYIVWATAMMTMSKDHVHRLRTLMMTANPGFSFTDYWANRWTYVAVQLEATLVDRLRAANAPASAPNIARVLREHSNSHLNAVLWRYFPARDLARIRAAVHKRLGLL